MSALACEKIAASIPQEYAGMRLDLALASVFPQHSRSRLQKWLKAGSILVDGASMDPSSTCMGGEQIVLMLPSHVSEEIIAEPIDFSILYEDAHILVLEKPAGLIVHPGSGVRAGTLMNALVHRQPSLSQIPRAGIVHRLDKDTSGLLVVAKNLEAQTSLVRQLKARTVRRRYLAIVAGLVQKDGEVEKPIGRDMRNRTRMAVSARGRPAHTQYFVREHFVHATLVECRLVTGRTHQIRVHMKSIGHPLLGDATYGDAASRKAALGLQRQALHAWQLALIHPATAAEMAWESPLPADIAALCDALRNA